MTLKTKLVRKTLRRATPTAKGMKKFKADNSKYLEIQRRKREWKAQHEMSTARSKKQYDAAVERAKTRRKLHGDPTPKSKVKLPKKYLQTVAAQKNK